MNEETLSYFTQKTEAQITRKDNVVILNIHEAKVKLHDEMEIELLKTIDPQFNKKIIIEKDILKIRIEIPKYYETFSEIHNKNTLSKWQFAFNLLNSIDQHNLPRVNLVICPENILISKGLVPHFIHYGVKESIPPYEKESKITWNELKATIACIVDNKYDFNTYFFQYETVKLTDLAKSIMYAKTYVELKDFISEQLQKEEAFERQIKRIPINQWKLSRYSVIVLFALLIPSIIFIIFVSFLKLPEKNDYIESNYAFLQNQFSLVIDNLEGYNPEKMPYVVQYQLAKSYIENESLTEEQKNNIRNVVSLQTDERYFLYWIYVGRGLFEEAIDIAKRFEDSDLILFALYKFRMDIQTDSSLKGNEREEKIKEIDTEIREYESEIEENNSLETEQSDTDDSDTEEDHSIEEKEDKHSTERKERKKEKDKKRKKS